MDIEYFDMNKFWVYIMYFVLLSGLFGLRLHPQDTLFILINVVIYTAITAFIFYFHTKYEEKKIREKYMKNILSIMYDIDPSSFEKNKSDIFGSSVRPQNITLLNKYASFIISGVFLVLTFVFFALKRHNISIAKVVENSYYLSVLGMTEIFVTFFVMSRMPYPDIFNIIDVMIRRREKCSVHNAIKLSGDNPYATKLIQGECESFSQNGDTCHTQYADKRRVFTCVDGQITRSTE